MVERVRVEGLAVDELVVAGSEVPLAVVDLGRVQADLAVRDSDAFLYRVGYHITLVGRIIFSPVIIL